MTTNQIALRNRQNYIIRRMRMKSRDNVSEYNEYLRKQDRDRLRREPTFEEFCEFVQTLEFDS